MEGRVAAITAKKDLPAPQATPKPAAASPLIGDVLPKTHRKKLPLMIPHTFLTALNALRRNKMRSALTALGVIIGVGAVIAMMGIGQGSKTALQKIIAGMGANMLMVHPGAAASGGISFGSGSVMTLTPQDAEEIARQCPAVITAAPIVRRGADSLRKPQLGSHANQRHHPGVSGDPRLGRIFRGTDVHRSRRP